MSGILRAVGAAALAAMLSLAAWSLHDQATLAARPGARRDPDLVGLLELYDESGLSLVTVTEGIQHATVTPDTTITVHDTPGTFADLRPGSLIAIWQRPDKPVAAAILAVPPPK